MSLSLKLQNAARLALTRANPLQQQLRSTGSLLGSTPMVTVSGPVTPLPITAPPMGSLKSTGVARSFSLGGIGNVLGGIGNVLGGIQSGGILGGIQSGIQSFFPGATPGISGGGGTLPGGAPAPGGGGIGTTGTAAGGCINTPFGSICLGGSAGPGSQFTGPGNGQLPVLATQPGGCAPRGYHLNKTGYYTQQGYVAPGTKLVRNRRRNPLNPRALSRSLSRLDGFDRATKAVEKQLARVGRRHAPRRSSPKSCGCKKR
jgi:hypothetical protein